MTESASQAVEAVFLREYKKLRGEPVPPFTVRFYPYVSLSHTIRIRSGVVKIRISDVMADAEPEILGAVTAILLHRLFRRSVPERYRQLYRRYTAQPEIRERMRSVRRSRGHKRLTSAKGQSFDLRVIFDELNAMHFGNQIDVRHLSWTPRKNRRSLGHFDPAHQAILINRRLDHPSVPRVVVEYVLYHEMLHAYFEAYPSPNCRHGVHHADFRKAERCFPGFEAANHFIHTELG